MTKTSKILMVALSVVLLITLVFSVTSISSLQREIADVKKERITEVEGDSSSGVYLSKLSSRPDCLFVSSKIPLKGKGVWFIVAPNGIPGEEGSHTNFAGFEVWRLDPLVPESYANLEWLEITSGSPCYMTDDFLISTNRFGDGKCRDLVFGTMRTDTNAHQIAFRIKTTDGRDIYTSFEQDVEILADISGSSESKLGLFGAMPVGQQAHIGDASENLEDLTVKFNELLDKLEAYGLLE